MLKIGLTNIHSFFRAFLMKTKVHPRAWIPFLAQWIGFLFLALSYGIYGNRWMLLALLGWIAIYFIGYVSFVFGNVAALIDPQGFLRVVNAESHEQMTEAMEDVYNRQREQHPYGWDDPYTDFKNPMESVYYDNIMTPGEQPDISPEQALDIHWHKSKGDKRREEIAAQRVDKHIKDE